MESTIQFPVPENTISYYDKLIAWTAHEFSAEEYKELHDQCLGGAIICSQGQWVIGSDHQPYAVLHPHSRYKRRVELYRPTRKALKLLKRLAPDARITYLEISLDWLFLSYEDHDAADKAVRFCIVKKYHRNALRNYMGTRYSDPRHSPSVLVIYSDKKCRLGSNQFCVHIEWRMSGYRALERKKLARIEDLLSLDHHQFWDRHLVLRKIDIERLGRANNNFADGERRRKPRIKLIGALRRPLNMDRYAGRVILRIFECTQGVIDECSKKFDVRPCLMPIDTSNLLPRRVAM